MVQMTDIKHFCVNENIDHLMHHLCTGQKYQQLKLKKYPRPSYVCCIQIRVQFHSDLFEIQKSEGCTVPRRTVMVLYILVYKAKEINSAEFSQGSFPCQVTLISLPQYKFSVLSAGQFFWFQLGEFGFKSNDILWLVVFFFLPITFPLAKVLILERQIPYWSSLVVQG